MELNSIDLTNEVADRLEDLPSHTVLSMHRIVKETIAVLAEHNFVVLVEPVEDDAAAE